MKKFFSLLFALCLVLFPLSACSGGNGQKDEGKIQVVCTYFPQYDWAREILKGAPENVELTLLLDSGVDLHSFQPTAEDIATISTCDVFIYIGGESESWIEGTLKSVDNKDVRVINLMETLGSKVKEEEISPGMELEGEEHNDHGNEEGHGNTDETGADEHVWLSLKNAEVLSQHIADVISELDADNASIYQANASAYREQLALLDESYRDVVASAHYDTVLFGDRFPFLYLVDDYNLDYYAAFPGCSSETAASFETIITLANIVDELELKTVMVTESSDETIAKAIIENTRTKDQQILTLDSMQSIDASDIASGTTYLDLASSNLESLKEVLN